MDNVRLLIHQQNIILIFIICSLMCCQIISVNCISSNDSSSAQPSLSQILFNGDSSQTDSQSNSIFNSFFTKDGHFRIFDDLIEHRFYDDDYIDNITALAHDDDEQQQNDTIPMEASTEIPLNVQQNTTTSTGNELMQGIQKYLLAYAEDALAKSSYELFGSKDVGLMNLPDILPSLLDIKSLSGFDKVLEDFIQDNVTDGNISRSMATGRLFIFKGLKKLLWPLFIGVQIAKSILLALFLPSILGSLGKMVGKGLTSISGFNHPSETVADLDFKDTSYMLDDDYSYPRPEASTNHFESVNSLGNTLSRYGFGDQKATYIGNGGRPNSLFSDSKNSHNMLAGGNKNIFKDFLKVPESSLLLSNYDPFYSPLLSRIDSVFSQLGLAHGNELCRSKLICLMYANPAKYAPYSNLVSAQLSRELNELRKPTSDNEEILRFFKYMRAAKDGQDGVSCDKAYESCTDFQDSENPVMITTYNDINKLVQARKFSA